MISLLRIGIMLAVLSVVMLLVHDAGADDDVKRKRVIIKVPHRVKHIHHHHTKKVHVHKVAKKKKPHKHVHVVVEEEEIIHPKYKSLLANKDALKWGSWKQASGFKNSAEFDDSSQSDDFVFDDELDAKESRPLNSETNHKGGTKSSSSLRGRPKGRYGRTRHAYLAPDLNSHHEIHHHQFDSEEEVIKSRPKKKSVPSSSRHSPRDVKGQSKRQSPRKTTKKPRLEDSYMPIDSGEYDELFARGPTYPERKEDPSWHEVSRLRKPNARDSTALWNLPKVPEVNEYIEDNDTYDPGVTSGANGGFYPSAFIPITTITSSVVQNPPAYNVSSQIPTVQPPAAHLAPERQPTNLNPTWKKPKPSGLQVPRETKTKKNPGYTSQISQTPQGLTVRYQSHIGHSSDAKSPSSSFQSFSLLS